MNNFDGHRRGDLLCFGATGEERRPIEITPDMLPWQELTRWVVALQRRRQDLDVPGTYVVRVIIRIDPDSIRGGDDVDAVSAGLKEVSLAAILKRLLDCDSRAGESVQILTADEEEWLRVRRSLLTLEG